MSFRTMNQGMSCNNEIDEADVRKAILLELDEWCIKKNFSARHERFHNTAVKVAIEYSKQSPYSESTRDEIFNKANVLSRDRATAIRQVLRNELETADDFTFWDVDDALGEGFSPFYRGYDRETESHVLRPKVWSRNLSVHQLDPFERFTGKEYVAKDYFRKRWSLPSSPMLAGYVFEALVAHHMVYHMQCESCKCRGRMFWNGGIGKLGSWADVVCRMCMASYEIKSRPSNEKVEQNIKFNSFGGNSFRSFCSNPARYQARYLVVASRGETYIPRLKGMAYRVSVARIQKVEPRLCAESFVKGDRHLRVISDIAIDRGTLKKAWFFLQVYNDEDQTTIAREVFDKYYGDGAWSDSVVDEPGATDKTAIRNQRSLKSPAQKEVGIDVEHCRALLQELKVNKGVDGDDDDWENAYSDVEE